MQPIQLMVLTLPLLAAVSSTANATNCDEVVLPAAAESPVGSWTVADTVCMDVPDMGAAIIPGCEGSAQDITMTTTGTVTFDAAGTYSRSVVQTTVGELRVPLACLATVEMPCAGEGRMGMAVVDGEFCVIEMNESRVRETEGAWTIEANQVTVTSVDDDPKTLTIYADPTAPGTLFTEEVPAPGARLVLQLQQATE